jgi:hypothetical protein
MLLELDSRELNHKISISFLSASYMSCCIVVLTVHTNCYMLFVFVVPVAVPK